MLMAMTCVSVYMCVQVVESLFRLMKECWHAKPTVRLTMLRVKKSLSKLLKETTVAASDEKLH